MPLDPNKFHQKSEKRPSAQQGVLVAVEWSAIIFAGMLAVLFLAWALTLRLPDILSADIETSANPAQGQNSANF